MACRLASGSHPPQSATRVPVSSVPGRAQRSHQCRMAMVRTISAERSNQIDAVGLAHLPIQPIDSEPYSPSKLAGSKSARVRLTLPLAGLNITPRVAE
jgi:hypothetical protein